MKRKIISILKYLLFLLIGIGLLWLVFRKLEINSVVNEIKNANYSWILLSFVFAIISHISRAMRWNIMINSLGYKTKTITTFYAVMVGYFANLAIPRIGEITRCGVLGKNNKIPVNSLIGTVISERIFDLLILILIIFFVIVFQLNLVGVFVNKYLFIPLSSKFSNNFSLIIFTVSVIIIIIISLLLIIKRYKNKIKHLSFYIKLKELINGFLNGIKTIKRMEQKWAFLFHTFIIWLMYFLMTYICFFAIKATSHLTVIDGITVLALGSLGIVAPVPGGIGAYHFIVKAILFELYGISAIAAASFATIVWTAQTILVIVLGAFSYFMLFLLKKRYFHEKT
ncbi:MAG: flippase-like domain-containing protein [Bacteroidales bacterium]|nr:flippase-like domain-containing protein [Bacteroidales bacterium]